MKCYIIENGVERLADPEDLLPILEEGGRREFQDILRAANREIDLAAGLAHLNVEMKEPVYRNVSPRVGKILRKRVSNAESRYSKDDLYMSKRALIDHIGKYVNWIWFPEHIIWKKTEEDKAAKPSTLEYFIKRIEEALDSGELRMAYCTDGLTQEDIRRQIGEAFQDRPERLRKIRRLAIMEKDLDAAALLFEKAKIEELEISGKADGAANGFAWPSFLENCHALTKLKLYGNGLSELPSWVRNASSLRRLSIDFSKELASLPDWIGDLHSLTEISISGNIALKALPDSIGNLTNLAVLYIDSSSIKTLPAGMGNLKNLRKMYIRKSLIEEIPDCIGNLQSLIELSLCDNEKLETLPDSIGNLHNLASLDLSGFYGSSIKALPDSIGNLKSLTSLNLYHSPIEKLPDTIVNCSALESVNILGTKITSVPDFISSIKNFIDNKPFEVIPEGTSISYKCFCNSYYKTVKTILWFHDKARGYGILALDEDLERLTEGFFKTGLKLVIDGTDAEVVRSILTTRLERENDFHRKKLMEVARDGILSLLDWDSTLVTVAFLLASLVDINDNPVDAACAKYLSGDIEAISNIDFGVAIQPEEEREEIRFIKRAMELSEISRREGLLGLEGNQDHEGIAARDVFEYGIVLTIDGWDAGLIRKILDNLIQHEVNPVRKNLAQAKEEAVISIQAGDNPRILLAKLCAYFDDHIAGEIKGYYESIL